LTASPSDRQARGVKSADKARPLIAVELLYVRAVLAQVSLTDPAVPAISKPTA